MYTIYYYHLLLLLCVPTYNECIVFSPTKKIKYIYICEYERFNGFND